MAETCRLRIYNKLHRSVFYPWKKHSRTTSHRSWKQWGWYSEWVYPPRTGWLEEDPTETLLGLKVTFWGAGLLLLNFGWVTWKFTPKSWRGEFGSFQAFHVWFGFSVGELEMSVQAVFGYDKMNVQERFSNTTTISCRDVGDKKCLIWFSTKAAG